MKLGVIFLFDKYEAWCNFPKISHILRLPSCTTLFVSRDFWKSLSFLHRSPERWRCDDHLAGCWCFLPRGWRSWKIPPPKSWGKVWSSKKKKHEKGIVTIKSMHVFPQKISRWHCSKSNSTKAKWFNSPTLSHELKCFNSSSTTGN